MSAASRTLTLSAILLLAVLAIPDDEGTDAWAVGIMETKDGVGHQYRFGSKTVRVSVRANGSETNAYAYGGSLSGSGRWAAFTTEAPLTRNDNDRQEDAYVVDLETHEISLESRTTGGVFGASLSASGHVLLYCAGSDGYLRNLKTGREHRVRTHYDCNGDNGELSGDASRMLGWYDIWTGDATYPVVINLNGKRDDKLRHAYFVDLSDNGKFAVYSTYDGLGYCLNLRTNRTRIFAHKFATNKPAQGIGGVSVSRSGRFIAFIAQKDNILRSDDNGHADAFRIDMRTGQVRLITKSWRGNSTNRGGLFELSISADGNRVALKTLASNLVPGDKNRAFDIYVRDIRQQRNYRVTIPINGRPIRPKAYSWLGEISANGKAVIFLSAAENLVPGDRNERHDVFVRY